jgi:hypothetical protein
MIRYLEEHPHLDAVLGNGEHFKQSVLKAIWKE